MMNVLYLLNFAARRGTERYVESLVKYLSADGLIRPFFAYNQGGLLVERLEGLGVPCRRVEMRRRFDKQAARDLAALCAEWDIDLIHCHYLREHYTALLAKKYRPGLRVVYTNHFVMANDFVTRFTNRIMDKRQDQIIAVCTRGKEQLIANGWSAERIQVISTGWIRRPGPGAGPTPPCGLSWAGGGPLRHAVRLPLCRGQGAQVPHRLGKAAGRADRQAFTLVLAGDGPLLEPAKEQVKALGLEDRVVFLGFRQDMKNLFHGADLYVNSSRHEALSFLIIEAMAAGLPVIATDMGATPTSSTTRPAAACW